jgi:hypothetical protein
MNIIILSQDACKKAIGQLTRITAKVQLKIHQVAVSTLVHARDHGDVSLVERLLNGLPTGQRREALAYWYSHFSNGKLTAKAANGKFTVSIAKAKDRTGEDFNIEGAALVSFAELTKESKPGKTFTMEQLIKKLESWANEDGEYEDGKPKVAQDVRDAAANILAQFDTGKPRLRAVA